ncbi:MAG: amino acid ABC transporter permease [Clostridiales Family XIII bacterium]|jgi:polar amino acid transport system permease protein|nr:amino acid ABC transporter permease [Clostridiales Family XIII bacterium]
MNIRDGTSINIPRKRLLVNCVVLVAALAACVALAFLKPPASALTERISPSFIEEAGDKYNETVYDYAVFNIARGKDLRIAAAETYIGIAGQVFSVDTGFMRPVADVLLWLPALLEGAKITVSLSIIAVFVGVFMSVFLALGKMSKFKPLSKACGAYIFFFRGTPLLMQLFFVYYGLPQISSALTINNKFLAAFIAFTLNSAAYCAEIIRAAIQSIDKGQFEASRTLGLTYAQTMRLIIIPQSIRRLIPPIANEFIMVLKDVSLVSIIALSDLTHMTRSISSSSNSVLVYIPAMIIYLIITAFFSFVFDRLEKRYSVYQ